MINSKYNYKLSPTCVERPRREDDNFAAGGCMLSYEHQNGPRASDAAAVADPNGVTIFQNRAGLGIAGLDSISVTAARL